MECILNPPNAPLAKRQKRNVDLPISSEYEETTKKIHKIANTTNHLVEKRAKRNSGRGKIPDISKRATGNILKTLKPQRHDNKPNGCPPNYQKVTDQICLRLSMVATLESAQMDCKGDKAHLLYFRDPKEAFHIWKWLG